MTVEFWVLAGPGIPAEMVPAEMIPAEMVPAEMVPAEMVPEELVPAGMVPVELVHPACLRVIGGPVGLRVAKGTAELKEMRELCQGESKIRNFASVEIQESKESEEVGQLLK